MITALTQRPHPPILSRIQPDVRRTLNIPAPISSTRLRDTLKIVDHEGLRRVLRRQVRHDRRCGFLKPSGLAINAVAIDGKFPADLKSWDHPAAQKVVLTPSTARGRCRVLNALLISSQSPACLDASPIPGKTNEIGHMPDFLKDLDEAYGKTGLLELIMADGGSSSRGIASQIHAMGSAYAGWIRERGTMRGHPQASSGPDQIR